MTFHYNCIIVFNSLCFLFLSLCLSLSAFDRSFCVYFCMFPVCPLCCFIVIAMDPVSEINDDDDDNEELTEQLCITVLQVVARLCMYHVILVSSRKEPDQACS